MRVSRGEDRRLLSEDEARWIAANIAKLPHVLHNSELQVRGFLERTFMNELKASTEGTTTIQTRGKNIVLKVKGDLACLPASLKLSDGKPRFHLAFPKRLGDTDQGAKYLVSSEAAAGYDPTTRDLLEKTLRPHDLFIDVGAHWGFFTLQAATHPAGNVSVIAFEPDPTNASILLNNIANHGLNNKVSVVCTACGDNTELAPLVTNSSMMHSVRGVGLSADWKGPAHWVSIITLDSALAQFPQLSRQRVILKIDVEGFEPKVIEGARGLLLSGRVALIVWEYGLAFSNEPNRDAMRKMVDVLSGLGFQHLRLSSHQVDAPLSRFSIADEYVGNVYSYNPNLLLISAPSRSP